jgi:transcriptional regulator with XRE-family HTH domain
MPRSSIVRENEVGATLRRFREGAQLSTRELARRMGVASSYVSKVELGQLGLQPEFCKRVARVLGLARPERDLLAALLALHLAEHHSVPASTDALRQAQRAVRSLERSCHSYRIFQPSLIPGLLQTRAYVQAVFSRLTSPSRVMASLTQRLSRQEILKDHRKSFQFLIADWALGPHWCSDRTMAQQLRHLEKLSGRPNIAIRVLPHDFRFPEDVPPLVSGFELLDDAVVVVDTLTGFMTLRRVEDVTAYGRVFDSIFHRGERFARSVQTGSRSRDPRFKNPFL